MATKVNQLKCDKAALQKFGIRTHEFVTTVKSLVAEKAQAIAPFKYAISFNARKFARLMLYGNATQELKDMDIGNLGFEIKREKALAQTETNKVRELFLKELESIIDVSKITFTDDKGKKC
jgi:hypothetical protein